MLYNYRMNLKLGDNLNASKAGMTFSVTVAFYVVVSLIISLIISASGATGDVVLYFNYLCSPIAIVCASAFCLYQGKMSFKQVAPAKCGAKYYLIALLLIFGLLFSLSYLNGALVALLKLCGYTPRKNSLPSLEGWGLFGAIVVIAVIPALAEEFVFRGIAFNNAQSGVGTVRAVLLTGFIFALYHGSVEQTIYQFICGCLFALLTARSGSVIPAVIVHFLNNAVILALTAFNLTTDAGGLNIALWAEVLIIVLSALCFVGAVVWLILDKKPLVRTEKEQTKEQLKGFFVWGFAGIFVMALIWILGLFGL